MLAKVLKSTGKEYVVETDDGKTYVVGIRGKIRLEERKTTNPVAVGDTVEIKLDDDKRGRIISVLPRSNYIIRKSVNLSKQAHIIAANVDRAYLLVTLVSPKTHVNFIDRFLVSAEAYRIPVTLLFNKVDLYQGDQLGQLDELTRIYTKIGYPCHSFSAINMKEVSFLRDELVGMQVVFSGNSGTGKSTLINAIDSQLSIKTKNISAHHQQGQHTTTFAEMHKITSGGYIIDTPGIKSFGLVDIDKKVLGHYFPEMRELMQQCKFNNCQHINEPKCAIKESVENGEIAFYRYLSYLKMMEDDEVQTYR